MALGTDGGLVISGAVVCVCVSVPAAICTMPSPNGVHYNHKWPLRMNMAEDTAKVVYVLFLALNLNYALLLPSGAPL